MTVTEARRTYYREWAKKNPDKVKANRERFFKKKAEELTRLEEQQVIKQEA